MAMINTLNETHLHRTIKSLYALQVDGSTTEAAVGPYIADIVRPNGDIVEIQTGSLGRLLPKISYYISDRRNVTVVFPLATEKYIETRGTPGSQPTRRKSPKKQTLYSMFRELTTLAPLLLDERLTLDVLDVTITEEREATPKPVQSANGRRRFCKSWLKTGKRLDELRSTQVFHGDASYRALLPQTLSQPFSAHDLFVLLRPQVRFLTEDSVRLLIWVYVRMGLIQCAGTQGRKKIYSL